MDDLIKALTLIRKHMKEDVENPVVCRYDVMILGGLGEIDGDNENIIPFSEEEINELERLGFDIDDYFESDEKYFGSFKFGSI